MLTSHFLPIYVLRYILELLARCLSPLLIDWSHEVLPIQPPTTNLELYFKTQDQYKSVLNVVKLNTGVTGRRLPHL